jgi:dUTP pyrophosphatase
MVVKLKKLYKEAIIPKYQSQFAAGFDLHSLKDYEIKPKERVLVQTGLAMEIESGYELQIRPRSGLALKHGITVLNTPGTVDSDYRGEIMVLLINHSDETFVIKQNERIAQGVIQKIIQASFVEVEELEKTQRGEGGFGSTGK